MNPKRLLRRSMSLLTVCGILTAQLTTPASAETNAPDIAYTLVPETETITSEAVAQGDVTVHIKVYIENNPGLASVLLTFGLPDGFTLTNGAFSDPYCFGDGTVASAGMSTTFNSEAQRVLWYSGQNGGVENDLIYDASLPFVEFDVTIPEDTPDGVYPINFVTEPTIVGTNANGDPIYTSTASTIWMQDGVNIVTLSPEYNACTITIGTPDNRGDVNLDGQIDNRDAQLVLSVYSKLLIGEPHGLTSEQVAAGDIDESNTLNSLDAIYILRYYAAAMLSGTASWDEILQR